MTLQRARCAIDLIAMGVGFTVPMALTAPAGADSATTEFAAVTASCVPPAPPLEGQAHPGGPPIPIVTLYNMPSGASPTLTATISNGLQSSPLDHSGFVDSPLPTSAQFTGNPASSFSSSGATVMISGSWTDGVGGSGDFGPVEVAVPYCSGVPAGAQSPQGALAITADSAGDTYWILGAGAGVGGFNAIADGQLSYGNMAGIPLNAPIVSMTATPDGFGYWLLGADGGVFSFGLAHFYGSTGSLHLNAPVVAMASTPDGGGYWFVAKDGGVFAYGDARFYGSMGGHHLNAPIVGMSVDQATGGYWLVASDGGIFAFNASFHGSAGSLVLNSPIVGMEAGSDGTGYRLAASDGGVFSYNLPFSGSFAGQDAHPMVGIAGEGNNGYWLLDRWGSVYAFGSAPFHGG
jgi:hypothetical protein